LGSEDFLEYNEAAIEKLFLNSDFFDEEYLDNKFSLKKIRKYHDYQCCGTGTVGTVTF
jgi:hypothetical protein